MTAPRSAIILWAGISFADALGFGMVAPMLPFIAVRYGASAAVITQLVAIYGVATFAGGPLLGVLSDRVGRLLVVKSSLLVSAIGLMLMAFASSLAPIFLFRAVTGICAGRNSVVRAILVDATPQERHLSLIGWLAAAGAAGACLGPAVAGLVVWSIPDGRQQFLFVCSAAGAANLAFLLLVELQWSGRGPTHTRHGSGGHLGWGSVLWSGGFPIILFQIGACAYCQGVLYSVTPLLVLKRFGWGAMETGGLLAMTAFLAILVRLFVLDSLGRLAGPASLVRLYSAVLCLALIGMGVAGSVAIFLCAFAAISTAMGVAAVLPTALAASRSLASMRGARLGFCQGTGALSLALGASVSGLLFDCVGENSPLFVAAGMAAICICLTPWLGRQEDAADRAG